MEIALWNIPTYFPSFPLQDSSMKIVFVFNFFKNFSILYIKMGIYMNRS